MPNRISRRNFIAAAFGSIFGIGLPGVNARARFVIFQALHGYSSCISLEEARKPNVILAELFCGRFLPLACGAPLRGRVPDLYLYKSVKWIEGIRFCAEDQPGHDESRGFSNSADPWAEERYNRRA